MASKLDRLQKKGFKVNEAALSKIAPTRRITSA